MSFTELLQFALKAQKESMKYEFYVVAQLVSSSLRNIYCTLKYFFIHCEHFKTLLQMLFKKILPILTRAALVNQPLRMHRRFIFWSYIWVQGELWPWTEILIKYKKETKSLSKGLEKTLMKNKLSRKIAIIDSILTCFREDKKHLKCQDKAKSTPVIFTCVFSRLFYFFHFS